jgi:hypothetical protein
MIEDTLHSQTLVGRQKYLGNKVLGFFADSLQLRNCINDAILSNVYFKDFIALRISLSVSPSKGGVAESRV